ncbi:MAG TPA: hypothetical protein PKO15_17145 [Fibrobacteria bacterium]|nr:hypothetical protein [Fibrobacteria bacterium]HOX50863.1 hypothetical protein [Fibrobacteria bacterium]
MKLLALAALLGAYLVAFLEPGGYLLWSPIKTALAIALLALAAWVYRMTRSILLRFSLVLILTLVVATQWGLPGLRSSACGEETIATLSWGDAQLVHTRGDCGATTGDAYRIFLTDGSGLFRRRRTVFESYLDPVPTLVSMDSNRILLNLAFGWRDSVAHLEVPWKLPFSPCRFYRGEPSP